MSEIAYEVVSSAPTDAVVGLYQAGGWWHEDPVNRTIIPQMIRGSFCFLVAREPDGRVVGMGRVISDGVSDAYIQDVVVLDACRGRGIGREIVPPLDRALPRVANRLDRPGCRAGDAGVLRAAGVPRPRGLRADDPRRRARWTLTSSASASHQSRSGTGRASPISWSATRNPSPTTPSRRFSCGRPSITTTTPSSKVTRCSCRPCSGPAPPEPPAARRPVPRDGAGNTLAARP